MRIDSLLKAGAALFCLTAMVACGRGDNVAGDPNSSETENTVAVVVQNHDGTPAAKTILHFTSTENWETATLEGAMHSVEVNTNEKGQAWVHDSLLNYSLMVQAGSAGIYQESGWDKPQSIVLEPLVNHTLVLNGEISSGAEVCLKNTMICATVTEDGSVAFDNIPPGTYSTYLFDTHLNTLDPLNGPGMEVNESESIDSLLVFSDSILLEDFEDLTNFGNLHSFTGTSSWWVTQQYGTATPSDAVLIPDNTILESPGNSVLQIEISSTGPSTSILFGLDFGIGENEPPEVPKFLDLNELEAFRIRIKGTSSLKVTLQSESSGDWDERRLLEYEEALTGDWQWLEVKKEDFQLVNLADEEYGFSKEEVLARISSLVLELNNDDSVLLDEIWMYGIHHLHFYPSSE